MDNSEHQRVAQAMSESDARLQAIISSLDDLVFELDENGTYLGIWTDNDALLAAPRSELLGRTLAETISDEVGLGLMKIIGSVLESGRPEIWEYCLEVPAGIRWFESRVAPIATSEGSSRRVTAPKAPGEGSAVIYVDLDEFKSVNDRLGHAAGDCLLVAAADRLRGAARKGDAVGRLGGDEFLVICPRVESSAQAVGIAERVAAATEAMVDVGTGVVELRTSVGVAWTTEAIDADEFLAQADSAMYESKRTRRKGVTLFATDTRDASPLVPGAPLPVATPREASDIAKADAS